MVLPLINKDIKEGKKWYNLLNFVTFKELQEKSAFLKIAAHAFEARNFLNIYLKFCCFFEADFLIKTFLIKKRVCKIEH